ncbi:hypothetical protein DXT63_10130 [Thermoanaerobacteraceae bacterium SP2]|nr:hypothetical protein DXT63_10130 [Thermoanaerobacteraceae bacterium SP2]
MDFIIGPVGAARPFYGRERMPKSFGPAFLFFPAASYNQSVIGQPRKNRGPGGGMKAACSDGITADGLPSSRKDAGACKKGWRK